MKCIVLCSGKGGTGKSCVAAYTGEALAKAGKTTLLMELGEDSRSLDLILGSVAAPFGVRDLLAGRCEASDAIRPVDKAANLFLMSAGHGDLTDVEGLRRLLQNLSLAYDFVLVDGADIGRFPVQAAGSFLVVVTPDALSIRASADLVRRLYAAGAFEVRLIINNVPPRIVPMEGIEDFDAVINQVGAQLLGVIPASPKLQYCANNGQKLDAESLTVQVFENIAARLAGARRPLLIR